MKIKKFVLISFFLLVGFLQGLHAQLSQDTIVFRPELEREFGKAMKLFRAGKFDIASTAFVSLMKDYPRSHRATGAAIMGGKAFYELKNYRESLRLLKDLIDLYPQSNYIDDAHYTLGLDYYQMERYEDAAVEFLMVVQGFHDQRLVARSKKMLELITSSNLTVAKLQLLQADAKTEEMKALIIVRIAEKILQAGDYFVAGEMLRSVSVMPPNIKYVAEALTLLEKMKNGGGVKIGAVLPLMLKDEKSVVRTLGIDFLQGIQLAVNEYNQTVPVKIDLEVRDTERDPGIAARHVAELCSDEKVTAIIGPIISGEVYAAAGIANERGVPLVTPTATANGIAAIGPFIFQANPDFDIRGRSAAAFAFSVLGARRFAVLAPTDFMGKQMAESFIKEVDTLGGEMIDVQWYAAGSSDLRTEITAIRRKALEKLEVPTVDFAANMKQAELNKFIAWGVDQRILDSLIERRLAAPVTLLFGERGIQIADSLKIKTHLEKMKYDSLGLPVANIDVIFIPIASSEEIPVVSSQLKFFNIQAQVLGTGDWNDMSILDQSRQYTEKIMFTADAYIDLSDEAYQIFTTKYQQANNSNPPTINSLFGYDVARMILQIISQGKTRRSDVAAALASVKEFTGLHSKISLALNRVNSYLAILQYKNRQILKIGEIDLTAFRK